MDTAILDSMLQQYENIFTGGIGTIQGYAINTLWLLIGIDFILSVLLNLQDGDHMKNLLSKIFKYGFWVWIVTNYSSIIDVILDSLTMVGFSVGGGMSSEIIKHPSQICDQGIKIAQPFLDFVVRQNSIDLVFSKLGVILLCLFALLGIWLAFTILAIQVCVTYIEFYVCATLLFIFIPFGANKHLSFLAEKAIGAIFSFGVKLMVLGAIIGVSGPIVNSWADKVAFEGSPEPGVILSTVTVCWIITFLAWQAPALAAGMMSGAPSLSAGTIASAGVAAAAGTVGGGMATVGATKMATGAAGAAANAGMAAAGAYSAGGMSGVANMAANSAMSAASGLKEAAIGRFQSGVNNSTPPSSNVSTAASGGSSSNSSAMAGMAMANHAQKAVPPEGAPQGGIQAPISNND